MTDRSKLGDKLDSTDTADVRESKQRRQRSDDPGAASSQLCTASEDDPGRESSSGAEGRGHKERNRTIDWKYCLPGYYQYECSSCRKTFEGWRWHYAQWQLDFCADCAEYCLDSWKDEEKPDDILNKKPKPKKHQKFQ